MPEIDEKGKLEEALKRLYANRPLAHKVLFPHKHKNADPPFHQDLLSLFYSPEPWVAVEAFRGGAKSTRMEELVTLCALFGDFRYAIIIGNSYDRACERLAAVKHELETNEGILGLFGDQAGGTWAADQIVLPNGCKIQAFGARQSLRGAKHNDARPDFCFVDDLEDEENVATEDARRKIKRWFNGALIPALDPTSGKIRMVGTPLHPKSLLEEKMRDPAWRTAKFPAIRFDDTGVEASAWPDRFPMEYLNRLRDNFVRDGNLVEFAQEYLCRSEDAASKPFQASMIRVVPSLPLWRPIQIMVDPARTTKVKTSARTGYAVWSWMGSKLTVHEAFGAFHKPDEIVKAIFDLDEKFHPVEIGVEVDGLEEFLLQPLRAEMLRRGVSLPLSPQRAPRSKDDFIKGLQPFYMSGEVEHAGDFPDLVTELLQFPTGRKDVPNALAYAPRMRAGKPVYDGFSIRNIVPSEGLPDKRHPVYLAVSARPSSVAGVLVQFINKRVVVYQDWVKEGPPLEMVESLVQDAIMAANKAVVPVAPKEQFDKYNGYGLPQAFRNLRMELRVGAGRLRAQNGLASWISGTVGGDPAFVVHDSARWLVNGLSRGYARKVNTGGMLSDNPEDNLYALVCEALEAFVGWFSLAGQNEANDGRQYATAPDGRRYLTTRVMP